MKKTLLLCLIMLSFTIPSIVHAERNIAPQEDSTQQEKYKRDKQLRDKQQHDQQGRDKQLRDKQLRDKQQRDQQGRDKQLRDKQLRDKQQRDQQGRDKQLRDKQLRDKQQRDHQGRDHQERDKHQPQKWQQNHRPHGEHHNWSHPTYRHKIWQRTDHRTRGEMPFKWHQKFDHYSPHYHMEPIYGHEWNDRFPGLHLFRWQDRRGEGFWYRNQRIVDAMMFYDDSDELVSIGFVHDGIFVMLRDDEECYENNESFFLSWWNRNGGITIRL